jgi:hypothetical protein
MLLAGVQAPRPNRQVAGWCPAFPRFVHGLVEPCSTARIGLESEPLTGIPSSEVIRPGPEDRPSRSAVTRLLHPGR